MAPLYDKAIDMHYDLKYGDSYFIIVGTSFHTGISYDLKRLAERRKSKVIVINENAVERVPKLLERLHSKGVF